MMISPIGTNPKNNSGERNPSGFTLIELILVMAILSVVLAMTAPSLSRFIHRQSLQDEIQRFLSVTQYAYNESISTGIPLYLWIDADERTYGLAPVTGFETQSDVSLKFELDESIQVTFYPLNKTQNGRVQFIFYPDGSIDTNEIETIRFFRDKNEPIDIVKSLFRPDFQVRDENYDQACVALQSIQ